MTKENGKNSAEELVVKYLKKNKNFFIKYPELTKELNFPLKDNDSDKVIDLAAYRYKKISQENIDLQNQMTKILLAGKSHITSQKRILKSTLRILNTKSLPRLIDVIISDLKIILGCKSANCFFTNKAAWTNNSSLIDNKIASSYFRDGKTTNLNQNPKGILVFFPNKSKVIKSYMLLKINYASESFIIALGSKNGKKFSIDQQVDLINYLIKYLVNYRIN